VSEIPSPARREQGPATQAAATALPAVLIGLAVVLAAQTLGGQGAMLSSPETEHPCEYSVDILRVSLPGQAGQPAEIDFTSNDFATYKRNLGLGGDFGSALLGKRVLDVGAGLSDFVDVLTDTYGAEALAVDLAYAEVDLEGLPEECVDLFYRRRIAMDAQRILFPSNYFDLVVSHSLLKWFFLFEPTADDDVRERIQRGMDILGQMVRVTNKGGEVRTTDFPDPYGAWFERNYPQLVDTYRLAYKQFVRPYVNGAQPKIAIAFHYEGAKGYTVITKLERAPQVDVRGTVSVIRAPRRPSAEHPPR
jgi:ubiquinone/menaquinone biosynthesis C-methylase UbiE